MYIKKVIILPHARFGLFLYMYFNVHTRSTTLRNVKRNEIFCQEEKEALWRELADQAETGFGNDVSMSDISSSST